MGRLVDALVRWASSLPAISGIVSAIVAGIVVWVLGRAIKAYLHARTKGISFGPVWLGASLVFGSAYLVCAIALRVAKGWSVEEGLLRFLASFEIVDAALGASFGPASAGRDAWIALILAKISPFLLPVYWTLLYGVYLGLVLVVAHSIGAIGDRNAPTGGVVATIDDALGTGLMRTFWHAVGYHGSPDRPEPRFVAWCERPVRTLRRALWLMFPLALTGTLPPVAWIAAAILVDGMRKNLEVPAKPEQKDDKPGAPEPAEAPRVARPSPAELVAELESSPDGPRLEWQRSQKTDPSPGRLAATDRLASESALLKDALARLGLARGLWVHQALVADKLAEGESVLLTAAILSGRTTVGDVVALREVLVEGRSVLYVLPDARASARRLEAFDEVTRVTNWRWNLYFHDLAAGRSGLDLGSRQPVVLFTTPDALHEHLMPFAPSWDQLFASLSLVIVSQIDRYSGARAANVALVLQRLRRHAKPRFLVTAPPYPGDLRTFAERLVGVPLARVGPELDGAPAPAQEVLVAGERPSAHEPTIADAVATRALALAAGYRAELVGYEDQLTEEELSSANDVLMRRQRALVGSEGAALAGAEILVVRAGTDLLPLLPTWTRHCGAQAAALADSASVVELGGRARQDRDGSGPSRFRGFGRERDGAPDQPGASTPKPAAQAGGTDLSRSARDASAPSVEVAVEGDSSTPSVEDVGDSRLARVLALYLPDADPLSRTLCARADVVAQGGAHPLLRPGPAIVGAAQSAMARVAHLRCALSEGAWTRKQLEDTFGAAVTSHEIEAMRRERRLVETARRDVDPSTGLVGTTHSFRYAVHPAPHGRLRLDAVTPDPAIVRDRATGETLFWVDRVRSAVAAYPGCVFVTAGRRYEISEMAEQPSDDRERLAEPIGADVRSSKVSRLTVEPVLGQDRRSGGERRHEDRGTDRRVAIERSIGGASFRFSHPEVAVREHVDGAKRWSGRGKLLEVVAYDEPAEASWLSTAAVLAFTTEVPTEALHAIAHLYRMALPVAVRHGPFDLDVAIQPSFGDVALPTVAFVDLHPGGAGFAAAITAEVVGRLSRLAIEVLDHCPAGCGREDGCPACLKTWHCHEADSALSRSGARATLAALLGMTS